MKLTHTADNGLSGILIGLGGERRVLFRKLGQRHGELVYVSLCLGFHRHTDNRVGEHHRFKYDGFVFDAYRITGAQLFEPDCGADITCLHKVYRVLLVAVHLIQSRNSFFLSCAGIEHIGT